MNGTKKLEWIKERLSDGMTVYLQTALQATKVTKKNFDNFEEFGGMFKTDSNDSLYIRRGKNWDCVDYCRLSAS